jgi:hypothetical protein
MRKYPTVYAIREKQMKTMTCYFIPSRTPQIWRINTTMMVRMYISRNSHSLLVGIENDTCTLGDSLAVSCKTKFLPIMFTAALFIIDKTWKQPRCPSVDE